MKPAIPNFARQFWLGYALPVGLLALGVDGLSVWAQLEGRALRAVAIAVVAGGLLLLALAWWRGIPTFRAAVSYVRRGGAPLWGYGAQVVVGLTSLLIALAAVWVYAPELGDWLNLSLGRDPDGQASLQASPDGRSLRLQGHLGQGDAARLQAVMAATPTAYLGPFPRSSRAGARRQPARPANAGGRHVRRGLRAGFPGRSGAASDAGFQPGAASPAGASGQPLDAAAGQALGSG